MRVVFLNPCGSLGGAETSLLEILSSLRAASPQWRVQLVLGEDGPFAAEARARGVSVIVEPFPQTLGRLGDSRKHRLATMKNLLLAAGPAFWYRRRLARLLRALHPDVIQTNGFKMHLLGAWSRPASTPLIWHIHDYVSTRRLMSRLLRLVRKACSLAIVNSRSVAADVQTVLPNLKIVPIYNAVDTQRFSPTGATLDLDALAGLPPASGEIVRVGLVGTFARWKGHQVFLEALAQLRVEENIRGYVIGGPIYQTNDSQWSLEELRQQASMLGLQGRVGFTGFQGDIPSAMRSLDIVVHASTEPEPFGMVIIEAMACGKALVASRDGGAAELFIDGQTALGHIPGDASDLAMQIRRMATNAELRANLGVAGRASVEKHFDGRRLASQLLAVFHRVSPAGAIGLSDRAMESWSVRS